MKAHKVRIALARLAAVGKVSRKENLDGKCCEISNRWDERFVVPDCRIHCLVCQ